MIVILLHKTDSYGQLHVDISRLCQYLTIRSIDKSTNFKKSFSSGFRALIVLNTTCLTHERTKLEGEGGQTYHSNITAVRCVHQKDSTLLMQNTKIRVLINTLQNVRNSTDVW